MKYYVRGFISNFMASQKYRFVIIWVRGTQLAFFRACLVIIIKPNFFFLKLFFRFFFLCRKTLLWHKSCLHAKVIVILSFETISNSFLCTDFDHFLDVTKQNKQGNSVLVLNSKKVNFISYLKIFLLLLKDKKVVDLCLHHTVFEFPMPQCPFQFTFNQS